jgi:16S rRNA (uracil1498-N3)-methyltransferase
MRKTRVYVDSKLSADEIVTLSKEAAHHLLHVLKHREGDIIHAFDGNGGYFEAEIIHRNKKTVSLRPERYIDDNKESNLNLTLVQGISRGQKMDYTIQKAVELGVRTIIPLMSEFSNVRLDNDRRTKRLNHWRKIIINACEQCGRNLPPVIQPPTSLDAWIKTTTIEEKLVLDPGSGQALASVSPGSSDLALICGPEGGLSESERTLCVDCGCRIVSLGPRILRTETAAVAALVICQSKWGDIR